MSPLSTDFLTAVLAQATGVVPVFLLEISHESIEPTVEFPDGVVRICTSKSTITHDGHDYLPYGFTAAFPEVTDTSTGDTKITIDNVTRWLTEIVRNLTGEPEVTLKLVTEDEPNVVQVSTRPLIMKGVTVNASTVVASIGVESYVSEPFPCGTYSPNNFRALF